MSENPSDAAEIDTETNQQPSLVKSETAGDDASSCGHESIRNPVVEDHRPFDHTNRKVVIFNVNKHMKPREVDALVSTWKQALLDANIKIDKVKKPLSDCLYVTVESESMVEGFINLLNSGQFTNKKGEALSAKRGDRRDRGMKGARDDDDDNGASKKPRITDLNEFVKTDDEVRDAIAPLWRQSYDEQLDQKARRIVTKCLVKIISETKAKFNGGHGNKKDRNRNHTELYDWLKGKKIPMEKILGAPLHLKYRNKCEFTFGYFHHYKDDNDRNQKVVTKIPSVGFLASGWAGGVSFPHCLPHISDEMCGLVDLVHEFLQDSPIPPYDPVCHRGLWRIMTVRVSQRTKQCMVIIQHGPATGALGKRADGSDDYSLVFECEKQRLIALLTNKDLPLPQNRSIGVPTLTQCNEEVELSSGLRVTSIFFQEFEGVSQPSPDHPVQHVYGKDHIEERLLQSVFQISPGAFFQVTTDGAEVLYKLIVDKVKEVTPQPQDTLLFDVCCGTGTIGLTCLKEASVGSVIGVDISAPAIKDARVNAEKNGFGPSSCASFISARAEHVMTQEVQKSLGKHMIAVVDPAREGLHPDVIRAIRNSSVQRLVYVSCNPTGSLIRDSAMLCAPPTAKYRGLPFKPSFAQPVDMFPHTDHCELVLVLDRMTPSECGMSQACKT